jgi:hypothetical protein
VVDEDTDDFRILLLSVIPFTTDKEYLPTRDRYLERRLKLDILREAFLEHMPSSQYLLYEHEHQSQMLFNSAVSNSLDINLW